VRGFSTAWFEAWRTWAGGPRLEAGAAAAAAEVAVAAAVE